MDNQRVTYAELTLMKNSKRQHKKLKDPNGLISVMEQEIIYAQLSLQNTSQELQGSGKHHLCKGLLSPPEKVLAGILGTICLALISAVVSVIATRLSIPQNNSSALRTKNANHCDSCTKEWFTYSNNCYYLNDVRKTFNESISACSLLNSSLLYIDNEEEMTFLQNISLVSWIGVSRKSNHHPWISMNGSEFKLHILNSSFDKGNCVALTTSSLITDDCGNNKKFACKRKFAQYSNQIG